MNVQSLFIGVFAVSLGCSNTVQDSSPAPLTGPLSREERARAIETPANTTGAFRIDGIDLPLYGGARLSFDEGDLSLWVEGRAWGEARGYEFSVSHNFAVDDGPSVLPPDRQISRDADGSIRIRVRVRANPEVPRPQQSVIAGAQVIEGSSAGRLQRYIGYHGYEMDLRIDRDGLYAFTITGEWVEQSLTAVVPTGRTVTLHGAGRMLMGCSTRVYVPGTPTYRSVADPSRSNPRCRELFGAP